MACVGAVGVRNTQTNFGYAQASAVFQGDVMLRSVELFAGAGGLAMGTAAAGFRHLAVVEWNQQACATIRENQERGFHLVADWPVHNTDVATFDYSSIGREVDLLAGGPPCQPFSIGGKHRGDQDNRNLFPELFRAVRELKPRAVMVENVKGLLRESFAEYFEYITLQLSHPEVTAKKDEDWRDHLSRLERHHTGGTYRGLSYRVIFRLLNAADYGVPQRRERVFIVAFRSDLDVHWAFPERTHSMDALLRDKWVTGDYWERHGVAKRRRPDCPERLRKRIQTLGKELVQNHLPVLTVRDALAGLPEPVEGMQLIPNHMLTPGARTYPGHTGSDQDEPAKTLKAGDHGVPGGENMLRRADGSVRYFTVRESARLQTFADDYTFPNSWTEAMRQLGNAVPVRLAAHVAHGIRRKLATAPKSPGGQVA